MCQKRSSVNTLITLHESLKRVRVDSCIRLLIWSLNNHGYNTVACCCGHGRYPLSIICQIGEEDSFYDLVSGEEIPRTRNFYKMDDEGYYYIPEAIEGVIHDL